LSHPNAIRDVFCAASQGANSAAAPATTQTRSTNQIFIPASVNFAGKYRFRAQAYQYFHPQRFRCSRAKLFRTVILAVFRTAEK
jgi:hypothetical protein